MSRRRRADAKLFALLLRTLATKPNLSLRNRAGRRLPRRRRGTSPDQTSPGASQTSPGLFLCPLPTAHGTCAAACRSDRFGYGSLRRWQRRSQCALLAQSGHHNRAERCPLLGVKQTSARVLRMSVPHPEFRPGSRSKSIDDRVHCVDLVLSIDFSTVRSSTKHMATGRPATAPAMPALKCRGVQRLSALSTASR